MEEAPRGTFQDELEWCISQLENGLLRLNPIPEQAEESQRILRVLCSRKAPSVKKRQVMHRVFGDYRLKMAEERKRAAKAAVTEKKETTDKEMNAAAGGSSKRKKRKKQPSKVEPSKNVNEESRLHVKAASDQAEVGQPDEQMKREVDWCVEQLELGLKTRKSTPKQMGEALRAIKILRSEKAVLAKKRQIMRLTFGDYRKKMAEERQKQLTLMQAASKAARITEVTGDACRRSSRAFRKSVKVAGRSQNAEDSPLHFTRTADACSFRFSPSQEEFQFNFF